MDQPGLVGAIVEPVGDDRRGVDGGAIPRVGLENTECDVGSLRVGGDGLRSVDGPR